MEWIFIILSTVIAYLIGSVSTAILVGKVLSGDDIRNHGSGNAGATNALRTYGKKTALLVLLGDVLKAVVAVGVARLIWNLADMTDAAWHIMLYASTVAAVLGHNFPLYFKFRGGKGVLVSTVAIFFADWRIGLCVLVIALSVMIISKFVSLGSVIGAVADVILVAWLHGGDWLFLGHALILATLLIFMHRTNIKRLLNGTENKLGQKKD